MNVMQCKMGQSRVELDQPAQLGKYVSIRVLVFEPCRTMDQEVNIRVLYESRGVIDVFLNPLVVVSCPDFKFCQPGERRKLNTKIVDVASGWDPAGSDSGERRFVVVGIVGITGGFCEASVAHEEDQKGLSDFEGPDEDALGGKLFPLLEKP